MWINFNTHEPEITDFTGEPWQYDILDFLVEFLSATKKISIKTSGSTGIPKITSVSKSAMKESAKMTGEFFNLKKNDTALLALPIQYIAGKMMVVRSIYWKMNLLCIEPKVKLHIPVPIDFAALTPMQAEESLSGLINCKTIILGGSAIHPSLKDVLKELDASIYETYGMTETLSHVAVKKITDTAFTCLKNIEVEKNTDDCLVVHTPFLEQKIYTHDIAEIISSTQFKLIGRKDNVINSGGVKIHPEQLEEKLRPHIHQDFIFSYIEDETLGQKLVLIVKGNATDHLTLPEGLLKKYEIPKNIYFLDNLVWTANNKINRPETRKKLKNILNNL